jgi:hypothetical protein
VLGLRRFPVASIGIGYTSVWHRGIAGEWTLYADVPLNQGCGRYFADIFTHTVVAPIRIDWIDARSLVVEVDGGQILKWRLDLASSPATTLFNAAAGWLPPAWWANRKALSVPQTLLELALRAGRMRFADRVPPGVRLTVQPEAIWEVDASRAVLDGVDLGILQADAGGNGHLELWPARRPLFAAGALTIHAPGLSRRT